jgi:hypothetical protein
MSTSIRPPTPEQFEFIEDNFGINPVKSGLLHLLLKWYSIAESVNNEDARNYILGLGQQLAAEFSC